ncbi:MAG: cytochrome c3 family protein [Leptospirales bacterium]
MKRKTTYIFIFIFLFVATALLYTRAKVQFSHKKHDSLDCVMCHTSIPESTKSANNNLPDKSKTCIMCHQDPSFLKPIKFSKPSIKMDIEFNHNLHTTGMGLECSKCHSNIYKNDHAGNAYPAMDTCQQCHNDEVAPFTCSKCHKSKVQFPHKTHQKMNFECSLCHAKIGESKSTTFGPDIPSKKLCLNCHQKQYPKIVQLKRYRQRYEFNHSKHIKNFGFSCDTCHAAVKSNNSFTAKEMVPPMQFCSGCHNGSTAPDRCDLCHVDSVPRPANHDFNWTKLHKTQAAKDRKKCMSCHITENFCQSCHEGTSKPITTHNPNYELTHKFESIVSMKNCQSCHSNNDCTNCHIEKGVTQRNNTILVSPHPTGWLNKQSKNFHARRARMGVNQCRSCHIKTDCNFCHIKK